VTKKQTEAGPKVLCAFDAMVSIDELQPNPRNPNTHSAEQTRLLAKLIGYHGWRVPIAVSNLSGFIVRGHGRYEAAKLMGLSTVPVDYQDYESEADEWADLVTDNRIAELATPDMMMLKDILEELNNGQFDMELTAFTDRALEDLMTAWGPPSLEDLLAKHSELDQKEFWPKVEMRLSPEDFKEYQEVLATFDGDGAEQFMAMVSHAAAD